MAEDYELQRSQVVNRYDSLQSKYYEAAQKFSLLLVTNLMLINAGGLLALANGAFNSGAVGVQMLWPASFFVVGLVLALGCGYATYLNFSRLGDLQAESRTIELWDIAKRHIGATAAERGVAADVPAFMADGRSFADFLKDSDAAILESHAKFKKGNWWVWFTFWVGQITGIASVASFVTACILMVLALSQVAPQTP